MTAVALALAAVLFLAVGALTGLLARQQRAHARREDALIDRIMHLTGRTWTPPPAEKWTTDADPLEVEPVRFQGLPEQHAV